MLLKDGIRAFVGKSVFELALLPFANDEATVFATLSVSLLSEMVTSF
jgi:hypothetical protein